MLGTLYVLGTYVCHFLATISLVGTLHPYQVFSVLMFPCVVDLQVISKISIC